jgi:hypothetical protein
MLAGIKVAVIKAGRGGVDAVGADAVLAEVDGDKVPTGGGCQG